MLILVLYLFFFLFFEELDFTLASCVDDDAPLFPLVPALSLIFRFDVQVRRDYPSNWQDGVAEEFLQTFVAALSQLL